MDGGSPSSTLQAQAPPRKDAENTSVPAACWGADLPVNTAFEALVALHPEVESLAVLVVGSGKDVFLVTAEQTSLTDTVTFTDGHDGGSVQLAAFVETVAEGRVSAWLHNHVDGFAWPLCAFVKLTLSLCARVL